MSEAITQTRQIDLGREDSLVPWSAWFHRSSKALHQFHGVSEGQKAVFRVTLIDARVFAVTHVQTHVSRGRCFVGENRFGEKDAVCDVITGYTLVGSAADGRPTALVVPPEMLASVECVAVSQPDAQDDSKEDQTRPFGFAAYQAWDGTLKLEEIEEQVPAALQEGAD